MQKLVIAIVFSVLGRIVIAEEEPSFGQEM
jgi:hypothetical protein